MLHVRTLSAIFLPHFKSSITSLLERLLTATVPAVPFPTFAATTDSELSPVSSTESASTEIRWNFYVHHQDSLFGDATPAQTKAIGRLSGEILGRGFEGILQSGDSPLISEERRSFERPTHAMDGNDVIGILDQITAYLPTEEATTSALLEDSLIELSDPIVDFITKAPYQSERADEWTQRVLASIESISKENLRAYFLEYLDDETAAHAGVVRVQLQVNATIGKVSRLLRTAFPTKSIITSFRVFYPSPWLHTSLQQNPEN